MNEIREIHTYEEPSPSTTGWIVVLAVLIIGVLGFTVALWQPWAVQTVPSTTIIHDQPVQQTAPASTTTIINPPPTVVNPPKTDIRINETSSGSGGETGGTSGKETTGGETAGNQTTGG